MILENIIIKNFRCFKEFSLEFGGKCTVVFGKNGTGKTTLINALHKALSFVMYSDKIYTTEKVKGRSRRKLADIRTITNNNPYLKVEGFSRDGDYNNHDDKVIEIEANALLGNDVEINWTMSAFTTNNRLRPSEFIEAFREFYRWHQRTNELPVFAYYSDCFPHKEDNKKAVLKQKVAKLRNFGYFDWNAVEGCSKEWITRLEDNFFNIRQGRDLIGRLEHSGSKEAIELKKADVERWEAENNAIETCLRRFTDNLLLEDEGSIDVAGLGLHSDNRRLCIITKSGEEIAFDNLPSGYKRLFCIVLDLAFRSYILSGNQSTDTAGIAIIDEIDLHLHPELENVVLNQLMAVFPSIQFIVSTHSIGVLTSVKSSDETKVVMISRQDEYPQYFDDIYGIDVNSGLQEIMGVTLNGEELKRLIAQCAYMYSKNLTVQADRLKEYIASLKLISPQELEYRIENNIDLIN